MSAFSCDYCYSRLYRGKKHFTRRLGIESTKYRVIQCQTCGLVCLFPLPTLDELQEIYHEYADKKGRLFFENRRKENNIYSSKLEKLRRLTTGKKLLDIGAGLGTFVYLAREAGLEAIGIEYEKDQCNKAWKRWKIDLVNDTIENIYQNYSNFDMVVMHHVLEHVVSPSKIFDIIQKILKPGGIVLIEVPNQFFNIKKKINNLIKYKPSPPLNPFEHLYFFSVRLLKNYVDQNKFEIIEFNQFRTREEILPIWERIEKNFYRFLIEKTDIGGGSFFEMYLRKKELDSP